MTRIAPAMALAILIAFPASGVSAEGTRCGEHARLVDYLAQRHGETRRASTQVHGLRVELFASSDTGTWTVTVTLGGGRTCLLGSGHDLIAPDRHLARDEA